MRPSPLFVRLLPCLGLAGLAAAAPLLTHSSPAAADETARDEPRKISYGRDIRPILSNSCFTCHGPDPASRKADLRLDSLDHAMADLGGYSAIVPGDPEASELWFRVSSEHASDVMPPPDSNKPALTSEEQETFRLWIEQGAVYEEHWSFVAPARTALPPIDNSAWPRNEVDHFVLAQIEAAGLAPSAEADRATLLRRVFLDLTGLPPTPQELYDFLSDARPDAYERWVDRLLTEEPYVTRYAERAATPWLDAARYADTNGIHMDAGRQMWAWRDWLLRALRDNMPFDQFVTEQLAGDLLPNATLDQKVASGFHRNHVITDEGGAINEEYLVEYAADRTATTGSVFLGLTVECARCHDHKFDPISQQDYYSLFAFFNSNEEPGLYAQRPNANRAFEPFMQVPTDEQAYQKEQLNATLAALREDMETPSSEDAIAYRAFLDGAQVAYGVDWADTQALTAESSDGSTLTVQEDGSILASGENPAKDSHTLTLRTDATGLRTLLVEALQDSSFAQGRVGRASNGNAVLTHIEATAHSVADPSVSQPLHFAWAWADFEQANDNFDVVNALDPSHGKVWAVDAHGTAGGRHAIFLTDRAFGYDGGTEVRVTLHYQSQYDSHSFGRVRLTAGSISNAGLDALPVADSRWYGTWPYKPTNEGDPGYDTIFGPEADPIIDFSKKYAPDNYSWVFVPQVKDNEVVNALPAGQTVSFVGRRLFVPSARELEISLGSDDGIQVFLNGEQLFENRVNRGAAADQDRIKLRLTAGLHTFVAKVINTGGPGGFYYRTLPPEDELGGPLVWALAPERVLKQGANQLDKRLSETWRTQHSPAFREKLARANSLEDNLEELEAAIPLTMVMKELAEPRETFILMRGAYDHPDKTRPVTRAVPASLGLIPEDTPKNRLGLAAWLTADDNPLLARVSVNRIWEMMFGSGIVETSEDFGLQGSWPSHPELLDWLAVEYRESGWDTKAMVRRLVTSATYRQQSRFRPAVTAADPNGRLLAAYPRRRLGAEEIRDQALYVSGLLVEELGGPSVKPYQPEGLWREVAMLQSNTRNFERGMGDDLWRRSLYTYWKRAVPPPSLLTFDAPTREFCTIRRGTTNTPLQALVLWNDEQFVEAARVMAQRTLAEDVPNDMGSEIIADARDWRIARMFQRCTGRLPEAAESSRLREALQAFEDRYAAAPDDAAMLLAAGESALPEQYQAAELAAWTMLGNAILALDETISRN